MNLYVKEAVVGLLVLVGLGAFVAGGIWLRGRSLRSPDAMVVFKNIGNLKEGAPVRISGAAIGRVSEIVYRDVGRVEVGLKFDQDIVATKNAKASIEGIGMLGDALINFEPGQGPPLARGEFIQGTMESGLFDKGAGLADKASTTLTSLNSMLDSELVVDLRKTLRTTEKLMSYLADQKGGPASEVNATMRSLQTMTARLDSTMSALDPKQLQSGMDSTMRSTRKMFDQIAATTARMDSVMVKIQRGEGTMGKFASDTTLYGDMHKALEAMTGLINELKAHPGKIGITVRVP